MKSNRLYLISGTMVIIFSFVVILCPIEVAAKTKKNEAKVKQTQRNETRQVKEAKEARDEGELKGGQSNTDDKHKTGIAQETGKGETEGVLTKEYKDEDFKPPVEEESIIWTFIKMILLLAIFAGGFYYFYRFVTKKAGVSIFGSEAVKVLSAVPLGQNKFLHIVDFAGKILVLGVSDNAVNLISEITDRDQMDRIRILSTKTPPHGQGTGGFHDNILKQIGRMLGRMQGFKNRGGRFKSSAIERPSDIEFLRHQKNRLKNLNGMNDE